MATTENKPCVYCGIDMEEVDGEKGKLYLHNGECKFLPDPNFLITDKAYLKMVTGEFGPKSSVMFGGK